jgi:hypothetical protein
LLRDSVINVRELSDQTTQGKFRENPSYIKSLVKKLDEAKGLIENSRSRHIYKEKCKKILKDIQKKLDLISSEEESD